MASLFPVECPIPAQKRVPFLDDIPILGRDYSGSFSAKMEIRNLPGDTGTALVTLTNQTAGTEGISVTYDASYDVELRDGSILTAPASILLFQINETTLEALSLGTPYDEPLTLHYDLHVTATGFRKHVVCFGKFILYPGATI
tara:strand:- start:13338 stop:13766 length:429 start_codon:yes stop_codon:yes gene_type:complete